VYARQAHLIEDLGRRAHRVLAVDLRNPEDTNVPGPSIPVDLGDFLSDGRHLHVTEQVEFVIIFAGETRVFELLQIFQFLYHHFYHNMYHSLYHHPSASSSCYPVVKLC
jgi:hypothetical protein